MQLSSIYWSIPSKIFDQKQVPARERHIRKQAAALVATIALGCLAAPATAASEPSTRLVRCEDKTCLQISGQRDDAAHLVSINGRAVTVEGARRWRVHLPVETVREWSAPYARDIEVSLYDPETRREIMANVQLPIGLLGGVELASLVVSVR